MTLIGFCTFLNLYTTQPLLPLFQQIFKAPAAAVSLTVGATIAAVAISAPFARMVADAVGRKRVIVAALACLTVPTILAGTAWSLGELLFWRFAQGIFIPAVIATAMAYISEESPPQLAGATMSMYVTGTVVGGFAGRLIAGVAATHWHWQGTFYVLGALTAAGTGAVWALLPRSRQFTRQTRPSASVRSLWNHLRNPQLLATYAVGFHVLFSLVGVFTYIGFHLADRPFNLNSSALGSLFFVYLIGAVLTPIAGRFTDRLGNRRTLAGALVLSASGVLLTLSPVLPVIVLGLGLCCTGVFVCQAASSSQVGRVAQGARSAAAGLYVSLYYAGGGVGSVVPGWIWDRGQWPGCVVLIVTVQVLTAILALTTWKERPGTGAAPAVSASGFPD